MKGCSGASVFGYPVSHTLQLNESDRLLNRDIPLHQRNLFGSSGNFGCINGATNVTQKSNTIASAASLASKILPEQATKPFEAIVQCQAYPPSILKKLTVHLLQAVKEITITHNERKKELKTAPHKPELCEDFRLQQGPLPEIVAPKPLPKLIGKDTKFPVIVRYQPAGKPTCLLTLTSLLGSGVFGDVYNAQGEGVIKVNKASKANILKREIKVFQEMSKFSKSEHAISMESFGTIKDGANSLTVLAFENAGTNLFQLFLKTKKKCSLKELLHIGVQGCKGLQHFIKLGLVHTDIKPENLVLKDGVLKFIDFGNAEFFRDREEIPREMHYPKTSSFYSPPENLIDGKAGKKYDLWSFGANLYELATGRPLCVGHYSKPFQLFNKIIVATGAPLPMPLEQTLVYKESHKPGEAVFVMDYSDIGKWEKNFINSSFHGFRDLLKKIFLLQDQRWSVDDVEGTLTKMQMALDLGEDFSLIDIVRAKSPPKSDSSDGDLVIMRTSSELSAPKSSQEILAKMGISQESSAGAQIPLSRSARGVKRLLPSSSIVTRSQSKLLEEKTSAVGVEVFAVKKIKQLLPPSSIVTRSRFRLLKENGSTEEPSPLPKRIKRS